MVKFCQHCGSQLKSESAKFCQQCGKPVSAEDTTNAVLQNQETADETVMEQTVIEQTEEKKQFNAGLEEPQRKEANENTISGRLQEAKHKVQDAIHNITSNIKDEETIFEKNGKSSFYIVDFMKNLTKKSNIPTLIYLVLNVLIIALIIALLFRTPFLIALLPAVALYGISIVIALSPVGEWILRIQTGCKKIKRMEHINRLEPIFQEVYKKARRLNPNVPENVQLYINQDESANAFATGRRTICVTEGLLELSDEEIKATIGHEFGHLAHKDTDLILVISVGNMIITSIVAFIQICITVFHIIVGICCIFVGGADGVIGALMNAFIGMLNTIFVVAVMWLWTKIGVLLVMKSSRENEYIADEFSSNLGYGPDLCKLLDHIAGESPRGLFANLASSHPDKNERIAKLQEKGVLYQK